jgi:hypothetical protein
MKECKKPKYQFVWYWKPRLFFRTFDPKESCWAYIYDWVIGIGFLEIRKWSTRKLPVKKKLDMGKDGEPCLPPKIHHMRNPKSEENIKVMLIKEHNKVHTQR